MKNEKLFEYVFIESPIYRFFDKDNSPEISCLKGVGQ